jgi:hypothetical protein
MLLLLSSVYQSAASGPTTMMSGALPIAAMGNSVTAPGLLAEMRPILLAPRSVNHIFPSSPATMSCGCAIAVGSGNSRIAGAAWAAGAATSAASTARTTLTRSAPRPGPR